MSDYTLRYVQADPSGNTTLIVLDPVQEERYAAIASRIMLRHDVDQVGFFTAPKNKNSAGRIEMMGGEFCGNASRCLAAWLAMSDDAGKLVPLKDQTNRMQVEISGHSGVLDAEVENIGRFNGCRVTIDMPLPKSISHGHSDGLGEYSLVAFEGITHAVLWEREPDENLAPLVQKLLYGHYGGCFGLIFTDIEASRMTPLVYVEETDSLVLEGSCGSGTVAAAIAVADKTRGSTSLELLEPGGSLSAAVVSNGDVISAATLSGEIFFTCAGKLYLSL